MMNQIEEIKRALEEVDVSTARGRRTLHGKQINIEPSAVEVGAFAKRRAEGYVETMRQLRLLAKECHSGMPDKELECLEMVMEQLEGLALRAMELHISNF